MSQLPRVQLKTNLGELLIELNSEKAPLTVENFLRYVEDGFYSDTLFHRVIPGFMVQGGGFSVDFEQKPGQTPINNEAGNGLKNVRGSIAMARTNDPHSASSQFFINLTDNSFLNHSAPTSQGWGYAVFGQVVEGIEVVDIIAKQKTASRMGHGDVPVEDVIIESMRVLA